MNSNIPLSRVSTHEFERVWEVYKEVRTFESHFNDLQHTYRALASTWLLAVFAGVGFIYSKDFSSLPLPRELLVVAIGLAGCTGLTLLWHLDLRLYHGLLNAAFMEGLRLENEFSWLPQVRSNMMRAQTKPWLARVVWYYLGSIGIVLFIAGFGCVRYCEQNFGWFHASTAIAFALLSFGYLRLLYCSTLTQGRPVQETWKRLHPGN